MERARSWGVGVDRRRLVTLNDRFLLLLGRPPTCMIRLATSSSPLRETIEMSGGSSASGNLVLVRDVTGVQAIYRVKTEPVKNG
jgi:hypothetical protein